MKVNITKSVQVIYGIILLFFGLNGFFHFLKIPEKQGFSLEFLQILTEARYIFPLIAAIMTTVGTLLLFNKWVIVGLLIQLPISVNIFAFHLLHDWDGLIPAYIIFALNNFLIIRNLKTIKCLILKKV